SALRNVLAHRLDGRRVILRSKDGRPGHEHIGASASDLADVVDLHAPVDFEPNATTARIDTLTRLTQLAKRSWNELLSAESWIHRHDQHEIQLLERVVEIVQRRRGIEHEARLAAVLADQLDRAIDMFHRFGMKADERGTGGREVRHDAIHWFHHEMHVD